MKRTALVAAAVTLALAASAQAAVTEFIIYKQPGFRGASHTVKGVVNNLEGGFAREASSLVVRGGYWEVCNETHFKGDCHVLPAGEYSRLPPSLNERIVSVRFLGTDEQVARRAEREKRLIAREERREAREARREAR